MAIEVGKSYKVLKVDAGEYLTAGNVYICDGASKRYISLHRPEGTIIPTWKVTTGRVVLEEVN